MAAALRILVLVCLLAGVAHGDRLATAEAQFEEQEYAAVVKTLRPLIADSATTRARRLRALELTALSQLILGDDDAARATFERLLEIDPAYQLRDESGSPRIQRFFDDVKREVVPGFEPDLVAALDHAAPPDAPAGRRFEIDVRATSGAEHVKEVVFFVRRRGDQDYAEVAAAFRGDARWRIRHTPDASADPYTLEYYVEGRSITGVPVARIASPEAPLAISITAGTTTATKKWYRRWYVWAGVGTIVVGAGAVILATSGTDDGTLPPGRVTVTP